MCSYTDVISLKRAVSCDRVEIAKYLPHIYLSAPTHTYVRTQQAMHTCKHIHNMQCTYVSMYTTGNAHM